MHAQAGFGAQGRRDRRIDAARNADGKAFGACALRVVAKPMNDLLGYGGGVHESTFGECLIGRQN